ncbi:hypothetical protein [Absidia glauca]|uniref:Uncharacterized protein n=1 Tax=Absidia glauca TaxID=4829 RepID=A0A163JFP0_ABSGL|nr:hypothetical protein [Absidia glauca]
MSTPSHDQDSSLPSPKESSPTELVVDDAELLSILAADPLTSEKIHALSNPAELDFQTPTVALLDWDDWNDVPEFINNEDSTKKRKRGHTPSDSDDDDEEDFNFLDQFEFVDVSFDDNADTTTSTTTAPDTKKQKTTSFVSENAEDLSTLLQKSDSLMNELDYRWVLDITS